MRLTLLCVVLAMAVGARAADPVGSPLAEEALGICHTAQDAPVEKKVELFARGLKRAEEAVAADEKDPRAHFAVFCNLGEQLRLSGVSLSALFSLRRVRREVDRTLELAPDYADALAGKGNLLLHAPGFFGGDAVEGERLLRRALEVDPDYIGARLDLARALEERGDRAGARAQANSVRELAERKHSPEDVTAAEALLQELR